MYKAPSENFVWQLQRSVEGTNRVQCALQLEGAFHIPDIGSEHVLGLLNLLLKKGKFPAIWKKSNVASLLRRKVAKTQKYRPICQRKSGPVIRTCAKHQDKRENGKRWWPFAEQFGYSTRMATCDALKIATACLLRHMRPLFTLHVKHALNFANLEAKGGLTWIYCESSFVLSFRQNNYSPTRRNHGNAWRIPKIIPSPTHERAYDDVLKIQLHADVEATGSGRPASVRSCEICRGTAG